MQNGLFSKLRIVKQWANQITLVRLVYVFEWIFSIFFLGVALLMFKFEKPIDGIINLVVAGILFPALPYRLPYVVRLWAVMVGMLL